MTKTQHYNLNKPEAADPIRVADFNQNSDIIDGALGTLSAAVASAGNCKIASGTYTGTNKYGSANPTKLEVGFAPKLILIGFDGDSCRLFLSIFNKHFDFGSTFSSESYTTTWGDTYFSIYSGSAYGQMNSSGRTYRYLVIG